MNADEGDGSCVLELTLNFDSAELIAQSSVQTTFRRRTATR